jgi:uncharacterized surface protein with fasciclin (FAS1) repeats
MMKKWKLLFPLFAIVSLLSLVAVACGDDEDSGDGGPAATATQPAAELKDIVDTAVGAGNFTTLATALEAAGLVETLKGPGPFTVLAPTDAAFAALPAGTIEGLLADPEKLKAVLTYHVIAGDVPSSEVVKLTEAETVNGQEVKIMVDGGKVMINDATVTTPDVKASNGVIHVIDKVLLPE